MFTDYYQKRMEPTKVICQHKELPSTSLRTIVVVAAAVGLCLDISSFVLTVNANLNVEQATR